MCGATTPAEAVALYRAAYPGSVRTDAAIKTRYHLKIRPQRGATPAPDFAGDTVLVTQCEEEQPAEKSGGFYGDARALHADLMDGAVCDRPLSAEPDTFRPGDRVALLSDPDRVGEVTCVSPSGVSVSVQFPGDGPARVFAIGDLRRVV